MRRENEQRRCGLRGVLVLLLFIFGGSSMALEVSWIGDVYPQNGIDVEHVSGSVTLVAEIENVEITGLPDEEYEDKPYDLEYRWFVNGTLTNEHSSTITLADNQNNILGAGIYNVCCEARCHFSPRNQDSGDDLWTDWQAVGQHNATFFTLVFQRQDGTTVTTVKIAEDGSEKVKAVVTPNCSPAIILVKSSSNITASYQIPGIVTIGGNELGTYSLWAQYRGRTIATLTVNVLEAFVQLTIVP